MAATNCLKNLPIVSEIEANLQKGSQALLDAALDQLADHGIWKGAQIYTDRGRYQITKIEGSLSVWSPGIGLWVYGIKLRRDGTWGTHEHSLCRPSDI